MKSWICRLIALLAALNIYPYEVVPRTSLDWLVVAHGAIVELERSRSTSGSLATSLRLPVQTRRGGAECSSVRFGIERTSHVKGRGARNSGTRAPHTCTDTRTDAGRRDPDPSGPDRAEQGRRTRAPLVSL